MSDLNFEATFKLLTGNKPFPWQSALYKRFANDDIPASCNLPTGLGKTSVIAIWLIALANHPEKMPRRLVYVVNRRTVVDQTTVDVEMYRKRLYDAPRLMDSLRAIGTDNVVVPYRPEPLAISTLRGQFADNREWSADPSRPAVICGTVDMIGSRLLFSGYGTGFKSKPLHAGFLGQDVLVIHDEAHLEPAFQSLLLSIQDEQKRCNEFGKFRVMELTATSRGKGDVFELTDAEKAIPEVLQQNPTEPIQIVWQRLKSRKGLKFHSAKRDSVANSIGEIARSKWKSSGLAILIFVSTIEDVKTVYSVLTDKKQGAVRDEQIRLLTGTLRGRERDELATKDPVFARFMPKPKIEVKSGTVYLVCTSAGEVGVDISADHMVCNLSTLESMAQRFGRVNRRGEGAAEIDVVYENDRNPKPKSPGFEAARWLTMPILQNLPSCDWIAERHDSSPSALGVAMKSLSEVDREAAFAPFPTILPVTDILFDAWALTTIRDKLPGRPKVEPYLHGITDYELPETQVAWRDEVGLITEDLQEYYKPKELLETYPLLPHEILKEPSYRAFKRFEELAKRHPDHHAWIVDDEGDVIVVTLKELADKAESEQIERKLVLLDPNSGGLKAGMLDGGSVDRVADISKTDNRARTWDEEDAPNGMAVAYEIDTRPEVEDKDELIGRRFWYWWTIPTEGGKATKFPVLWRVHVNDVVVQTEKIVAQLSLPDEMKKAIIIAARFHDHGKLRKMFQSVLGNRNYPKVLLAKSGGKGSRLIESYRHEFGSLLELATQEEFKALSPDMKELVLHLIAAHHGRARPHFPTDEAFDPEPPKGSNSDDMAMSVPRRFARLQRKYGRWGLAYLESLLRAADWAASANPSEFVKGDQS